MHWYSDLRDCENDTQRAEAIADFYGCTLGIAQDILAAAHACHKHGNEGLPFSDTIRGDDWRDVRRIEESELVQSLCRAWWRDGLGDIVTLEPCTDDLARLFHSAWEEGITRKDRVEVILDNSTIDDVCECGNSVPNGAETCEACGSDDITRAVYAEVHDPFASTWAGHDQTIDGSSWESADGPDFVYTILYIHPKLVEELKVEGYRLDLSNFHDDSDAA